MNHWQHVPDLHGQPLFENLFPVERPPSQPPPPNPSTPTDPEPERPPSSYPWDEDCRLVDIEHNIRYFQSLREFHPSISSFAIIDQICREFFYELSSKQLADRIALLEDAMLSNVRYTFALWVDLRRHEYWPNGPPPGRYPTLEAKRWTYLVNKFRIAQEILSLVKHWYDGPPDGGHIRIRDLQQEVLLSPTEENLRELAILEERFGILSHEAIGWRSLLAPPPSPSPTPPWSPQPVSSRPHTRRSRRHTSIHETILGNSDFSSQSSDDSSTTVLPHSHPPPSSLENRYQVPSITVEPLTPEIPATTLDDSPVSLLVPQTREEFIDFDFDSDHTEISDSGYETSTTAPTDFGPDDDMGNAPVDVPDHFGQNAIEVPTNLYPAYPTATADHGPDDRGNVAGVVSDDSGQEPMHCSRVIFPSPNSEAENSQHGASTDSLPVNDSFTTFLPAGCSGDVVVEVPAASFDTVVVVERRRAKRGRLTAKSTEW